MQKPIIGRFCDVVYEVRSSLTCTRQVSMIRQLSQILVWVSYSSLLLNSIRVVFQ